jgi:hypothetical protein
VEQPTAGRLEGVEPPAEVDGDSTTEMEGDHVAGLKEGWTRQYMGGAPPPPSRPRQRPLLPLLLDTSTISILLLNRGAHKLIQGAALK